MIYKFERCVELKFAGIVYYNKLIEDSKILDTLRKHDYTIIAFDNSTKCDIQKNNQMFSKNIGIVYLSDNENKGVSFAYSKIVEKARSISVNRTTDWLTMFDDDSLPDESYFTVTNQKIANSANNKTIFLPIVLSENELIVSPCRIGGIKGYSLFNSAKDAKNYKGKDLSGINSGMLINLSVFDEIQYNTNLFIDHIDHDFINQAKSCNVNIIVLDGIVHHSLSEFDLPSKGSTLFRFTKYIDDSKIFYAKPAFYYHVLRRIVKYTIAYRSLDFIKVLFKKKTNYKE